MSKFGVCEWCLPFNGATAVMWAHEAGFDGIQLSDLGGAGTGFPLNDPFVQASYLQAAQDWNIELQCLHPYGLQRDGTMLFPLDITQGQAAQLCIEKCIDACAAMGIPSVMLSSFFATLIRNRWEFDVYAQHLKRAVQVGSDKGVRIVYESILELEQLERMLDIVGPGLTVCYDLINPLRYTLGSPEAVFQLGLERVDHFHIKDLPADLKGYVPIGQGCSGVEKMIYRLLDEGYDGWFVSENYYTLQAAQTGRELMDLAKADVRTVRRWLRAPAQVPAL